jgi:beta-glucosidase
VASISQPLRRLNGFQRVTLSPGQSWTVTFTLYRSDFGCIALREDLPSG